MLVLLCDTCRIPEHQPKNVICEVCSPAESACTQEGQRKLRILCLHGFRQTSKSFLGRTCALRKRLKSIAEFVFIDGPHELKTINHNQGNLSCSTSSDPPNCNSAVKVDSSQRSSQEATGSDFAPIEFCETCFEDQSAEMASPSLDQGSRKPVRPKRAWLVSPSHGDHALDENQYMSQEIGWQESLDVLKDALLRLGHFDGVFGFSQGGSVAAVLCALKQAGRIPHDSFKFAIIASGYISPVEEHQELLMSIGKIHVPSLHIFSVSGDDRQICVEASKDLLSKFEKVTSHSIRHNLGHIVPSTKSYVGEYKAFLSQFC